MKKSFLLVLLSLLPIIISAQDTIKYVGLINKYLIYESIDLYPDNTFKWTSEFDLSYSQYGNYKRINDTLVLNYYLDFDRPKTMSIADSIKTIKFPSNINKYLIDNDVMYRLNKNGKKIKRIMEPGLKTNWSWLVGHKFAYYLK